MTTKKCETPRCEHPPMEPRPSTLDQTHAPLPALTWECPCGWKRTERAK